LWKPSVGFLYKMFQGKVCEGISKSPKQLFPQRLVRWLHKITWNTILVFILSFAFLNKQSYLFFKALLKYYFSLASSFPFHFPGKMNGPIISSPLIFGIYFYIYICVCVCVCTYIYIHNSIQHIVLLWFIVYTSIIFWTPQRQNLCSILFGITSN